VAQQRTVGSLWVIAAGFTEQSATPTLTSRISHRICTNYGSGPGQPGGGEQLLHLLHTSYATAKTKTKTKTQQFQDQDQDFDVQDQDRDSRLTSKILEVRHWDGLWQTKRLKKSWQAENSAYKKLVVAHSKQQNIVPCLTAVLFRQLPLIIAVYQTSARTRNILKVRRLIDN